MNIINILIKLLSAAYTAEAKRADAKAQFNEQLAVKFADDAVRLAAQSEARVEASKHSKDEAAKHAEQADKLRAKRDEVANFLGGINAHNHMGQRTVRRVSASACTAFAEAGKRLALGG